MTEPTSPNDIATAWEPQRPGRLAVRDIRDAIVEPDWGGLRVVVAFTETSATVFAHSQEVTVPEELGTALKAAFGALDAVIEGNLTTKALLTGEGAFPKPPTIERPPILVPRALRQSVKDDPYVRARDHAKTALAAEPAILAALEEGVPHVFVATDLLWLDGQPLLDVPLLERKRLLGTVLAESFLVRVTVFVRPSAVMTLVTWGALGFSDLSYRSANSRYLPGRENPDWAVGRPPEGPHGPVRPPTPPR